MKKITLFFLGISFCSFVRVLAQELELLSTAGAYGLSEDASIYWSIGECVSETFSQSSVNLTQGFLQSSIGVTAISNHLADGLKIKLYPNPAIEHVILETNQCSGLTYELYSTSASILDRNELVSDKTQISFERLPAAVYYIKVMQGKGSYMTYKIVKK